MNECLLATHRAYPLFTTVLTYDAGEGEDEEGSLPHLGYGSKLPPGILPHGLPQVKEIQPAVTAVEQELKKEKEEMKESKYSSVLNNIWKYISHNWVTLILLNYWNVMFFFTL